MAFYNLALIYLPAIVVFMLIWRWNKIQNSLSWRLDEFARKVVILM